MKNILKLYGIFTFIAVIGLNFLSCPEPDNGDPALIGTVTITGTTQVGHTLAADTSALGGSGIITFQWMRSGNTVIGSGSTYVVQTADVGSAITVTVTRSGNKGSVSSSPTIYIVNIGDPTPGLAFTLINNNTSYSVSKGTASFSDVVIPAEYQGLPVVEFEDFGFFSYTNMTSIVIPNSVTSIGYGAFSGCTGLTSIVIPDSVTSIGNSAFSGCTGLTSIVIPNSVTSIGYGVFFDCIGLTSVTLGTILSENFNELAFVGNLRAVYFADGEGAGTYVTTNPGPEAVWMKQ